MSFKNLEQRFNAKVKNLYGGAKLKFEDGRPGDGPFKDPLLVRDPGDGQLGIKQEGRGLPFVSSLRDLKRLTLFQLSFSGIEFLLKQQVLQTGNTFEQTRIINPGFVLGNAIPFIHVRRHLRPTSGLINRTNTDYTNVKKLGQLQKGTYNSFNTNTGKGLKALLSKIAGPVLDTISAATAKKNVGEDFGYDEAGWKKTRPELGQNDKDYVVSFNAPMFLFGGKLKTVTFAGQKYGALPKTPGNWSGKYTTYDKETDQKALTFHRNDRYIFDYLPAGLGVGTQAVPWTIELPDAVRKATNFLENRYNKSYVNPALTELKKYLYNEDTAPSRDSQPPIIASTADPSGYWNYFSNFTQGDDKWKVARPELGKQVSDYILANFGTVKIPATTLPNGTFIPASTQATGFFKFGGKIQTVNFVGQNYGVVPKSAGTWDGTYTTYSDYIEGATQEDTWKTSRPELGKTDADYINVNFENGLFKRGGKIDTVTFFGQRYGVAEDGTYKTYNSETHNKRGFTHINLGYGVYDSPSELARETQLETQYESDEYLQNIQSLQLANFTAGLETYFSEATNNTITNQPFLLYFRGGRGSVRMREDGISIDSTSGIETYSVNAKDIAQGARTVDATLNKISYIKDPLNAPTNPTSVEFSSLTTLDSRTGKVTATNVGRPIVHEGLPEGYGNLPEVDAGSSDLDPIVVSFAMGNKNHVQFRAFITDLQQNITPDYTPLQYIGRVDKFINFKGVQRDISFRLGIVAFSQTELDMVWTRLNYLTGMVFPYGFNRGILQPNIIRLSIGNVYKDQPGYLTALNMNFKDITETWDIDRQVPIGATVDVRFVIIEKAVRIATSPFYGITEDNPNFVKVLPDPSSVSQTPPSTEAPAAQDGAPQRVDPTLRPPPPVAQPAITTNPATATTIRQAGAADATATRVRRPPPGATRTGDIPELDLTQPGGVRRTAAPDQTSPDNAKAARDQRRQAQREAARASIGSNN